MVIRFLHSPYWRGAEQNTASLFVVKYKKPFDTLHLLAYNIIKEGAQYRYTQIVPKYKKLCIQQTQEETRQKYEWSY